VSDIHDRTIVWLRGQESVLKQLIALDEEACSECYTKERHEEYLSCVLHAIHAVETTRESDLLLKLSALEPELERLKNALVQERQENEMLRETNLKFARSNCDMHIALKEIAELPPYRQDEGPTTARAAITLKAEEA